MKRYRSKIPTLFLLPVVLFLMGAELSREEKVGLWKEQFEAVRQFREGGDSLAIWKPGGIRASEDEALARLSEPKVHPLANTVAQSESQGSLLVFPQVADGTSQGANLRIVTSIILVGTGNRDAELVIRFFNEDGTPMQTSIGGVAGSEFSFSLKQGESLRVQTDGTGPLQVGWAKVQMSQPVGGTATFSLFDLSGNLNAEVGVDRALLESDFAIFAESDGVTNTGIAFANCDDANSNQVELILLNLGGQEIVRVSRTLGPNEKRSLFITELFPAATAGFEGVLILRSERPIGLLTLRQRGLHLTSLPAVGRFGSGETSPDLYFYRLGTGQFQNVILQTAFIFINNSTALANVVLELFQEDGSPLVVTIGGEQNSSFNLTVPALGALRVTTSETQAIKIGWAKITTDQALGAVATLAQFEAVTLTAKGTSFIGAEVFVSEVGVEAVIPLDDFNVFADSIGDRGTGLALSNTNASSEQEFRLDLYNDNNQFQANATVTVPPQGHTAKFLTELFPDTAGIEEFEGRVRVRGNDVVAGTLRVAGNLLTSLPTMFPLHGFQPEAEVEFHSLLGEADPSVTFKLQQFGDDMSLDSLEVSMPQVGFETDFFKHVGAVVISADTGTTESSTTSALGYLDEVDGDGAAHIRLARLTDSGPTPLGDMTLSGTPAGGFKAKLELSNAQANTFGFDDFFLQIFFPYSVLILPPQGTSFEATTEFTSVSTSRRRDTRLESTSRQQIDLPVFPAGSLLLEAGSPFRGRTQGPFGIRALNADPQSEMGVLFTGLDDNPVPVQNLLSYVIPSEGLSEPEGDLFVAVVPDGIKTGPVVLEQNGQQSNGYLYHVAFGPRDTLSLESLSGGTTVNFSAGLAQEAGEFMFLNWRIELDQVALSLAGLSEGQVVGMGTWFRGFSQDFEITVESIGEGEVVLTDSDDLRFRISAQNGGGVLIENMTQEEPATPQIVTRSFRLDWSTSVPLLVLPAAGQEILVKTVKRSVVTGVGPSTRFVTYSNASFTTE